MTRARSEMMLFLRNVFCILHFGEITEKFILILAKINHIKLRLKCNLLLKDKNDPNFGEHFVSPLAET